MVSYKRDFFKKRRRIFLNFIYFFCFLKGPNASASATDSANTSINVTKSPTSVNAQNNSINNTSTANNLNIKQSPTNNSNATKDNTSNRYNSSNKQQLAIETNSNSPAPVQHQLPSSSSSTSSSYMAKDLIGAKTTASSTRNSLKDQEQQSTQRLNTNANMMQTNSIHSINTTAPPTVASPSLLTPTAAAIAAALAFQTNASNSLQAASRIPPLLAQMHHSPFNQLYSYFNNPEFLQAINMSQFNPALNLNATAQFSQLNSASYNSEADDTIKNEVKKFVENLPKIDIKPLNNMNQEMAKQIMELNDVNCIKEKATRDEITRRLVAQLTNFDLKRATDKTAYTYQLHETAVQLCLLRPALLTRRDELVNYSKQILQNMNIFDSQCLNNGKR